MPPKKNLTKKSHFNFKKTLIDRADNSILIQCKANNYLLNCGEKYPYIRYEKWFSTSKFKRFC